MPLAKSVVNFEGLNENHSYCSAWLKDKERFCRRTVADSDQRRRRFLLQSISCDREYAGKNAEEIADLYFCKGWHRKGDRYAVPSTERRKVLQMCFPMAPSANEASTTPQPDETDRRTAPPSRPRYVVEREDSPFSLAPVLMNGNQTASLPSESSPVERPPWERDFHDNEAPSIQQLRRSARIRVLEPGNPSEVSRLTEQAAHLPLTTPATQTRQRARLREQEIGPPLSTNHPSNEREPSSHFAPDRRRSAWIQGQGQHANADSSTTELSSRQIKR